MSDEDSPAKSSDVVKLDIAALAASAEAKVREAEKQGDKARLTIQEAYAKAVVDLEINPPKSARESKLSASMQATLKSLVTDLTNGMTRDELARYREVMNAHTDAELVKCLAPQVVAALNERESQLEKVKAGPKLGGQTRAGKYTPLREKALELYAGGEKWPTKKAAAHDITPHIEKLAREKGISWRGDLFRTVHDWLPEKRKR